MQHNKQKLVKKLLKTAGVIVLLSLLTSGVSVLFAQNNPPPAPPPAPAPAPAPSPTPAPAPQSPLIGKGMGVTQDPKTGEITPVFAEKTPPSDIENTKAVPGDAAVQITWDAATDNVGVTGYKIYRGTKSAKATEDHRYDLPFIPVGNVKSYIVKNLINGKTYYFSVTAVDAAGNESVNYSPEVNATPQGGLHLAALEDDGKPPQVKQVSAEDVITVKVVFSEAVKLPQEAPASAFTIEKTPSKTRLKVQNAQIDNRDATGATVLLTTEPQEENGEYVLTAGIEVKDLFDNTIVSGTADTGAFKGSKKKQQVASSGEVAAESQPAPPPTQPPASSDQDKEAPLIVNAVADLNDRITISFSEKVVLTATPKEQFAIFKRGTQEKLNIVNVSLSVDEKSIYLTTDPQQTIEYDIRVSDVKNAAGTVMTNNPTSIILTGKASGIRDLIPPEDVTKLIARIKDARTNLVELKWEASKNTARDLADQTLYHGNGKKATKFGAGSALGGAPTTTEVKDLAGGRWYTFKITTKDISGNESKGAVAALYLPKTGPGMVAAGITALFMGLWSRKKKKKK